jgi:D-glucosaminate-6-phosphate ammonia-lyase
MRRDDHLVGGEHPQPVAERNDRIGVPDDAVGRDALARERRERVGQAALGLRARPVLVGEPVAQATVERGADDEHLNRAATRAVEKRLPQHRAVGRLVRDHKHPSHSARTTPAGVEGFPLRLGYGSPVDGVYGELGVKPILNARGAYTDLGGSTLAPEVWAAMTEANRYFADIPHLLEQSGAAIAKLVGAESARVTPGAAAGIALGTAACLTRGDRERIERLPAGGGRVLVQRPHRYKYDRCVRMVGPELVEVDDLEVALEGEVAAVFFPAHLDGLAGTTPLARACELAHAHGVPVLVDAAYLIEPPERMRELVASGADLVSFSAKYFGGPNAGGFVCGRRELVAAVAAVDFIRFEAGEHHRWGRPFKLDRQTIVAVYVALRDWFAAGAEARLADYARKVELLRARLAGRPGLDLTPMCFTMEETLAPEPVNCLHIRIDAQSGTTAAGVDRELQAGDPSVLAHVVDDALVVVVDSVSDEDDELLADRLAAAFS